MESWWGKLARIWPNSLSILLALLVIQQQEYQRWHHGSDPGKAQDLFQ